MQVNTKLVGTVIIAVLVAITIFMLYQIYAQNYAPKISGYSAYQRDAELNVFEGRITNVKVNPGKIEGISAYDRNCVGQPITECDAGIRTNEYGTLNFHYSHDMDIQPCIHMFGPEKVIVEILDSNGNARVIRTQTFTGGHHG